MPSYDVNVPGQGKFRVNSPTDLTDDQVWAALQGQLSEPAAAPAAPAEGIGAAFKGGFKRFGSGLETALESIIDPQLAAERGLERGQKISEQYAPGASLERVKQKYEQDGLFSAAKEAVSQIPSALAEQAPNMAAALGGARLGAMAGAPIGGPVGALVGGGVGALAAALPGLYASNLERQAQEGKQVERSTALGAAAPAAALEVVSQYIPLGRNLVGKILGPTAEKALARGSNEAIEQAAKESLLGSVTRGGAAGLLSEIPTEVTQQMLERLQAGLPLTTPDALAEYGEAAYGAGLVGGPFGAIARTVGRPAARAQYEQLQQQQAALEEPATPEIPSNITELPEGYSVARDEVGKTIIPSFNIMAPGAESPLATVDTEEEAQNRLQRYTEIRQQEREKYNDELDKIDDGVQKMQTKLDYMEATQQTGSEEYQQLKANFPAYMEDAAQKKTDLLNKIEAYGQPLEITPAGQTEQVQEQFTVRDKAGQPVQSFKTMGEAEAFVRDTVGEQPFKAAQERSQAMKALEENLTQTMRGFGLKDVGLKLVNQIEHGAVGAYGNKLIRVAMNDKNPLQTMRHESIHALKDLGFFTPQQWKALESRAKSEWIKTYLEGTQTEIDGQPMTRLEGYKKLGRTDDIIIEEAIADAFAAYDKGQTPPPGLIASLFKRLKEFFARLKQAINGAGFQTADDIFQSIERGELKPSLKGAAKPSETKLSKKPSSVQDAIDDGVKRLVESARKSRLNTLEERYMVGLARADSSLTKITEGIEKRLKDLGVASQSEVDDIIFDKVMPAVRSVLKKEARYSLIRPAKPDEVEISTQNPSGKTRAYDPITQMLSIDEKAVMEAMASNPEFRDRTIAAIKSYGFIPEGVKNKDVIPLFKQSIVNNLVYLYNKVPDDIRQRSKLWYDGANKISVEMADKYGLSLRQVAAIMAAMSPQKDWFQNVSMGERAIDILTQQGDRSWSPEMLQYAESYVKETKDRAEREKRQDDFEKIQKVANRGTTLNEMDIKSAAAFIRAYDEAFHSRQYRIVTPEGGFGDIVRNNDGTPSTMMWSTYGPIEKAVSIYRDGSRENVSEKLGFEHKIRSFYNNIAAPNSDIENVTIDTHAVAAALFESLAGTDPEVVQNFGGTGNSSVIGVGGTYGLIADAYRDAAKQVGVLPREMQSITWEAVRGLFNEDIKSSIKTPIREEWAKYRAGEQSFEQAREKIVEISRAKRTNDKGVDIPPPDWVGSGEGDFVENGGESYNKDYTPEGGVRLRESQEIRDKLTFNLSAVTGSIPGLRELYSRALKRDEKATAVLQTVAESSLKHLLSGTNARVKIERAKGVYLSDREPSLMVSAAFQESEGKSVLAALARFAKNFNQEQIHVRMATKKKFGFDYGDGSYVTRVYTIPLKKGLNDKAISGIIDQTGLKGFTVTDKELITYFVKPTEEQGESGEQYAKRVKQEIDKFAESVASAHVLAGQVGERVGKKDERLFVYGEGYGAAISYESISGNVLPKQSADTTTPRIVAEYLTGEPVQVFKQKPLNKATIKEQQRLAEVFDNLPVNDLKNPLVKKAYKALTKVLKEQFAVLPVKVELQTEKDADGNIVAPYGNSSAKMRKDIVDRNHMLIYPTTASTFGPEGFDFTGHPLLEDSGFKDIKGKPMLFNDVLRAVHDYFAHGMAEAEFGPSGEYTAWLNHMASTPDAMARWALTAETRQQNAWQNFRPGMEQVPLKDRPFSLQKAALPPVEFLFTGDASVDSIVSEMVESLPEGSKKGSKPDVRYSLKTYFPTAKEAETAAYQKAPPSTPEFKRFFGASKIMDEGRPQVMYHGSPNIFEEFNENKPIFVTPDAEFAEQFAEDRAKDNGIDADDLKVYPLWVRAETPFDYEDPEHVDLIVNKITLDQNLSTPDDVVRLKQSSPRVAKFRQEVTEGLWSVIEDPVFQNALKSTGFDSFNVKEGGNKNLAVFKADQVKSVTGNIGEFGENKNIKYSLSKFERDELPKGGGLYTLPKDTLLYHGAYKERADRIEESGGVLLSRPAMKVSGGNFDEGGLIFFGEEETAKNFAESKADPMAVESAREAGIERLPGKVFETATDRPYKLVGRNYKIKAAEAKALNKALGLPDYKSLSAGDPLSLAATRANDFRASNIERYMVEKSNGKQQEMSAPWPVIFRAIGVDGFYDSLGVALTADNGIRLIGKDGKLEKYSLPKLTQAEDDAVKSKTTVRESKGYMERILDAVSPKNYSYFRQAALNRYEALSVADKVYAQQMGSPGLRASQSAEAAAHMSDLHAGVAASVFGIQGRRGGVPVFKNGMTTVDHSKKGLVAILSPLSKFGDPRAYRDFQFYAGVKRGVRLINSGPAGYTEKLFELADIKLAESIRLKYKAVGIDFEAVHKDWITFNNAVTDYLVQTGVLSNLDAQKFKKYSDYIPFYRQLEGERTEGPNIFQSLSGVTKPKALGKGGESPLADFMETIVRNTHAAITAGMKNAAEQKIINVGKQVGIINDIAPGSTVKAEDRVKVLINGVKHEYQCTDRMFADATRSLNMPDLPFISFLSKPADLLRNMITREPGFIMTNLLRDSVSAYVTSGVNITPISGTIINFAKAMKGNSPIFEALMDAGIIGGYEFSANAEQSGERLTADLMKKSGKNPAGKRAFDSVWDGLEKATTASDAATRMAVYERVLAETGDEAEAMYRALEVMNFNRKGSSAVVRILTAAVPFLNARMQGLDVFYRAVTGKMNNADAKEIQAKFFRRGMMIMGLSLMYYFAVAGNPDYEKQEQETKDNNWLIPGSNVRIPIPFEVGILFKTIPERIAAYTFGNDTGKDFLDAMKRAANGFVPVSPAAYIPQTFKPIIEAMTNYSFFTQREIVGMGLKDVAPEFQVGPGTSAFAEFVGKTLGLSPIKVDYVFKGYTGTMGMYAVDLMDMVMDLNSDSPKPTKRFEQLPIIKRLVLDPEARGNVTNYYQLKDSVDTAVRTMNLLEKTAQPEEFAEYVRENAGTLAMRSYVSDLEKTMKELRDMKGAVRNSTMSGDQKRDALTAIGQAENNLTTNIQTVKQVIEKAKP